MQKIFDKKFLVIYISIFYALGITFYMCHIELITAFLILLFFIIGILFFKINPKMAVILYLVFILGIIRIEKSYDTFDFLENIEAKNVNITGRIISSKNITPYQKARFYLDVENVNVNNKNFNNVKSKILVNIDYCDKLNSLTQGDIVKLKGNLNPPKINSNPHQFNYKKYLLYNDCKNILYVKQNDIEKIKEPKLSKNLKEDWYFILKQFEITRNKIIFEHGKNIKSPKLELLAGIVFGSEAVSPDKQIKENFQNSGLLHLLAASGLNVALIYGIWWQIVMLLRFPYRLSIVTGGFFVILYTFMTGFPPSILRASTMLLFVLFGKLINRNARSVSLIFFVGFLILLFNPKMLFDIGFQLSFAVTLGLIICTNVIVKKFEKQNNEFIEKHKNDSFLKKHICLLFSPYALASTFSVPIVAQLWVIPLQIHYFNNLAPLSVLANIAIVPFIGILSFIGFISSIIALIPILNTKIVFIFDLIANPLLELLIKISEFFASFKHSLITTQGMNIFQIFNFWAIILFLTLNIKNDFKNKKETITLLIITVVFLCSFIKFDNFSKNLEIIMFDVKNADCFLIKTPKNKHIMIDCAKKTYRGTTDAKTIINPYLKNEKIKKIDILIITHFDLDHFGGGIDILKNNKVDKIYLQDNVEKSKLSKNLLNYIKNNNLNYEIAKNNEIIYKENNLELKTFKSNIIDNDNENSIVSLLTYKNKNILFMADAGTIGYNKIKDNLPNKIDIIKIGHHGAKNVINNSMIKNLKPDYALVSAGGERFIHPNIETILILKNNLIKTIITKHYHFTKIILKNNKDDFEFYHYDGAKNKLKKIEFNKDNNDILFHQSQYFKNLVKSL